eukprot:11599784-Heterocapsa_arctica.AAC.1
MSIPPDFRGAASPLCGWTTAAQMTYRGRGLGARGRRDADGDLPSDKRLQGDSQRRRVASGRLGMQFP